MRLLDGNLTDSPVLKPKLSSIAEFLGLPDLVCHCFIVKIMIVGELQPMGGAPVKKCSRASWIAEGTETPGKDANETL